MDPYEEVVVVIRGLAVAGGVLVLGGLALGVAPPPLADFGCPAALAPSVSLDQTVEVVIACEELRADRQNVVGGLVVTGLAALAGSAVGGGRRTRRR